MKSGPKCRVPNRTPIVVSTTLTANSATTQHGGFLDGGAQPPEDHLVGTDEQRRRASARAGAETAELDGLGHWWFTQDPQRGAATINGFWAGVGPE